MRDFSVLLVTDRPAINAFIRALCSTSEGPDVVGPIPIAPRELASRHEELTRVAAAMVDVGSDPVAAIEMCQELRGQRPDMPTIALVCCPHALTSFQLQTLASSCDSALDLHGTEDELRRALRSVARGHAVFHIDLGRDGWSFRDGIASGPRPRSGPRAGRGAAETETKVIDLIARGMSDREMARQLHLSPHTIGHYVDRLCSRIGVKNRVALAAWAGRHGYYHPQQAG